MCVCSCVSSQICSSENASILYKGCFGGSHSSGHSCRSFLCVNRVRSTAPGSILLDPGWVDYSGLSWLFSQFWTLSCAVQKWRFPNIRVLVMLTVRVENDDWHYDSRQWSPFCFAACILSQCAPDMSYLFFVVITSGYDRIMREYTNVLLQDDYNTVYVSSARGASRARQGLRVHAPLNRASFFSRLTFSLEISMTVFLVKWYPHVPIFRSIFHVQSQVFTMDANCHSTVVSF